MEHEHCRLLLIGFNVSTHRALEASRVLIYSRVLFGRQCSAENLGWLSIVLESDADCVSAIKSSRTDLVRSIL